MIKGIIFLAVFLVCVTVVVMITFEAIVFRMYKYRDSNIYLVYKTKHITPPESSSQTKPIGYFTIIHQVKWMKKEVLCNCHYDFDGRNAAYWQSMVAFNVYKYLISKKIKDIYIDSAFISSVYIRTRGRNVVARIPSSIPDRDAAVIRYNNIINNINKAMRERGEREVIKVIEDFKVSGK